MVSDEHAAVGVVPILEVESAGATTTRVNHQVLLLACPIFTEFRAILGYFNIVDGAHTAIK